MNEQQLAAMRQALDALEGFLYITTDSQGVKGYHLNGDIAEWDEFEEVDKAEKAITTLRTAIEQALGQGEPVAQCTNSDSWNCKYCRKTESCEALKDERNFGAPTAPQPQREWVGLTDEERAAAISENFGVGVWHMARAIEAKLREKNTGETK